MEEKTPFQFGEYMTNNILLFAIRDTHFLKLVRNVVEPECLLGEIAQQILKIIYDYYDGCTEKVAPGDYLQEEIKSAVELGTIRMKEEKSFWSYVEQLSGEKGQNKDYVISKLDRFAQSKAGEKASVEMGMMSRRQDVEGIRQVCVNVLRSGVGTSNIGMDFFSKDSIEERGKWYREKEDYLMPFGIWPFDNKGVYLQRKFFILIMGQEKRGKTWGGLHFGRMGLLHGLNVLHVTHESGITEKRLAERYEMNLSGVGASFKEDGWKHETPMLEEMGKNRFRFSSKSIQPGTVRDRDKVKKHLKSTKDWGGRLIIKEFPRGSCSIQRLESYIDSLEITERFIPDVLINDYPDIMKLSKESEYRHKIDRIYQDHSRISNERNCLVVGFSQVGKGAYNKKRITMADFAEDKRKAAHCDMSFAICQTVEEERQNRVRFVWVLDGRYGMEGSVAGLVQDYSIGQFCKKAYMMKDIEEGEDEVTTQDKTS